DGPRDPRPVRPGPHARPRLGRAGHLVGRGRDVGHVVPVVAGGHHLFRLVGDPEERHRRARARSAQGDSRRPGEGLAMDFAFTSDQQLLKNSARAFLDEHCKPATVRASWDDPRGDNDAMWKEMAQLGWLGLSLPQAHGGSGLGMVETAVLLEEMGHAACPGAYWPTILAATAIGEAGTDAQKKRWLPAIATGEARATTAFLDGDL